MARTVRHGGMRDGRKVAVGPDGWALRSCRNNARGYRAKVAVKRRGADVVTDWSDIWNDRRENNRVLRAAKRDAIRDGIQEYERGVHEQAREDDAILIDIDDHR